MKEHLLAIVFLLLLFLLYLAPLPDSFLNNIKNYDQEEEKEEVQEPLENEHNAIIPAPISRDSTRISVASATRYKNL